MAIKKHPYELSVWREKLNGSNSKIEEKGVIIGAHDMTYLGKATNLTLTRKINGTNTLTFQMPSMYFDSAKGEFVHNELIDAISTESKIKFCYKDRWYEFFVKKTDEKKNFKSYMITYTCSDAFIDELSRNGYGITFDTELYNNVEEIGTFTETVLEDSIWKYHPENNWGDFTEYKEEKLYRIPISQFKNGRINGYKLDFSLSEQQLEDIGIDEITNVFTKESRDIELSDDIARKQFWDQKYENGIINPLTKKYIKNIDNDGYIYVPYSCLSFCYGADKTPEDYKDEPISYDRAATEIALTDDNNLVIAPQSVDPRTIIQFYSFPKDAILEIDDAGVILNKEYSYFLTLSDWNNLILSNNWYIFEDIRLVKAQVLGAYDNNQPYISHTFRYLKTSEASQEALGNKYVIYDGYLSDINNNELIKGKKFSITNRSEINISEEIDQYTNIYNANALDFKDEYISYDWDFNEIEDKDYRVCSKIDTRQIVPQLARNFIQNGIDMRSTDGWSPMEYLLDVGSASSPSISIRGVINDPNAESISTTVLQFIPTVSKVATKVKINKLPRQPGEGYSFLFFDVNIDKSFLPDIAQNRIYWHHPFTYNVVQQEYEGIINWAGSRDDNDMSTVPPTYNKGFTPNKNYILDIYNLVVQMDKLGNENATLWVKNGKYYLREVKVIVNDDDIPLNFYNYKQWIIDAGAKQCIQKDFEDWLNKSWNEFLLLDNISKKQYLNNLSRPVYKFLYSVDDWIYKGFKNYFEYIKQEDVQTEEPDADGDIFYTVESGDWNDIKFQMLQNKPYNEHEEDERWRWVYSATKLEIEKKYYQTKIKQGQEIVNFGIIGQQQTIKKDKIYCLGISGLGIEYDQPIEIKIGKGTLVSEGEYALVDNTILYFNQFKLKDKVEFDTSSSENIYVGTNPPTKFILFKSEHDIDNPYFIIKSEKPALFFKLYLFEAYTKGMDCFPEGEYTYKYSGRDLFWDLDNAKKIFNSSELMYTYFDNNEQLFDESEIRKRIIFEDNIMFGTTYEYEKYYIQRLAASSIVDDTTITQYYDTMGKKVYLSSNEDDFIENELPLDAARYTEEDYKVQTNYIDLNRCKYYNHKAKIEEYDCKYNNEQHICFYQKFGYCPYRFQTEKHPRKTRTLSVSKSNRFNIIQELSKVFEIYPQFFIEHKDNGKVIQDDNGYIKKIFFITEKGKENKIGFRYEKNLKDISRNISSDQIVTKLYVLDVDSDLSKTGLCSIKTAEDNPSKDSYIIDLSYYITKGMLDKEEVEQDLYGIFPIEESLEDSKKVIPSGFLSQLGYYNTQYDKLTNNIINLQDSSFTELEANVIVNLEGIVTAQEQILKIKGQLDNYKQLYSNIDEPEQYKDQTIYKNYLVKLSEQQSILTQLIYQTFFTNEKCNLNNEIWKENCFKHTWRDDDLSVWPPSESTVVTAIEFFNQIIDFDQCKEYWLNQHLYTGYGILGQYNREYQQIQQWKLEKASYLKLINQISNAFYLKYEPYLKEGTWSDNNYLTDNAYYFGALDVAAEGAIPKVSYNISVVDISIQKEDYDEIYNFDLSDVTYVEDIGMFGINSQTGMPNRLKTLVAEITECPDDESKNNIKVQNFTTQFEDLFQQVTATVQSLTFNENIYKRSSNFTSLQNISNSSLQGALDTNELILLDTDEQNIKVDNNGTRGSDINNHANKYKLDGQGLFFSNDGGQHWSVGVGPGGINADYINVGQLDAGKIRIADKNYIYFAWDRDGIVAYRDPQGINTSTDNINDAAIFNKYGLTIMKNNKIKLRAGYEYYQNSGKASDLGRVDNEIEQGNKIGFFLFNDDGNIIFQTTDAGKGARIELTGEMYIKGNVTTSSTTSAIYNYTIGYEKIQVMAYEVGENNIITFEPTNGQSSLSQLYQTQIGDTWIDNDSTEYIVTDIWNPQDYKYGYNNNNLYIIHFIKYTLENTNNQSILTKNIAAYRDYDSSVDNYISIANDTQLQLDVFKNYSGTYDQTEKILNPTVINNCFYLNSYQKDLNNILIYHLEALNYALPVYHQPDTEIYWGNEEINTQGEGKEGEVGLFLNNKTIGNESVDDKERLLVTCKKYGNEIKNIFSVLKGGQLYIGGTIKNVDNTSISELPESLDIIGAGIIIDPAQNGLIMMDFNNIKNQDGSLSLTNYIYGLFQNQNNYVNNMNGIIQNDINQLRADINQLKQIYNNHIHTDSAGGATSEPNLLMG